MVPAANEPPTPPQRPTNGAPLALDLAFFAWHFEGREGVGRYDVLRPA